VTFVGELVPAGVAQHVRVHRKGNLGGQAAADHERTLLAVIGPARSDTNRYGESGQSRLSDKRAALLMPDEFSVSNIAHAG